MSKSRFWTTYATNKKAHGYPRAFCFLCSIVEIVQISTYFEKQKRFYIMSLFCYSIFSVSILFLFVIRHAFHAAKIQHFPDSTKQKVPTANTHMPHHHQTASDVNP